MVFLQVTPWATGQEATHAESDVLQTLAESGVIGVVLFGALAAAWLNMTAGTGFAGTRHLLTFGMRPGDQRSGNGGDGDTSWHTDGIPYALGVAVAGSVAAIAFQSLVEIPLRIPLIAWTLAALIALIAPLVSSRRRDWLVRVRCMWPERLVLTAALTCLAWSCWRAPGWAWFYRDRQAWLTAADSIEISHFLSVTPGSWNAWFELGDRLFGEQTQLDAKTDSIKAGWHALEQSVQCNPRSLALRNYLAWRYWDAGRRDEARHHRDAYMALAGTDPSVLERWQAAEWDAGYRDAARELVDQYALRGLDDVRASRMLLWLARKELAVGSVARARECLARALDATPADTRVIKLLAKCERRLGYHEREYELLERLVAFDDDGDVWWRIAQLQRDKGNGEKLKHALGMAVRCDGRKRREADQMWAAFILGGTGATSPEIRENNH